MVSDEAIRKVLVKAAGDAEFRAKALADPNAAVMEAAGESVPDGFELRFVDGAGADLVVVLPEGPELSDEELEAAAGGVGSFSSGPSGSGPLQVEVRGWNPKEKKAFVGKVQQD